MDQCSVGLAAQETPAGLVDVIRRLMHTASLEVVPGDPNSVETLAHFVPPQTRVYITSPAGRPVSCCARVASGQIAVTSLGTAVNSKRYPSSNKVGLFP